MNELRGRARLVALAVGALGCVGAQAFTFQGDTFKGSFDSTVSVGTGIRVKSQSCGLIIDSPSGAGAPAGCLSPTSMLGDQGDLNYKRGDAFTTYLKGNHELILRLPSDITFMARANWVADASATHTTGYLSAATPPGAPLVDGLADDARDDLRFKPRLLDLWVSKSFQLGEQQARVRIGNQVVSWGESLFLPGGLNSTNAIDVMRLSQPGTQLKEVFLPAPMISFASGLGHGLNIEAYVQAAWNKSYLPPSGSYWSVVNGLGKGHDAYGLVDVDAKDSGQGGVALRWQPSGTQLNLGLYAMNYHDKTPNFSYNIHGTGAVGWTYAENRKLYGISANFPVGDWAIGTELSYRPKDAVALNAFATTCDSQGGNCWVDEKRWQWHLTALYSMTPSNAKPALDFLRADTATLLAEAVVISYPNLKRQYGNDLVAAGGWGWGNEFDPAATPESVGSKTAWGYNFDFSWVYDGTLIPGWQVVPEIYYFQAVSGRTPNAVGLFMEGAKSANLIVSFLQNPTKWQFALNYAAFWGGSRVFDQPLRDRNFFGAVLSRNF